MAVSDGFAEHVRELLAELGPIQIRKMFGGAGVYRDGVVFGLIDDDTLYFKTDEATRAEWAAAGSAPFTFQYKDGRTEATSYWRLPAAASDDAEAAQRWARLGLEAALRKSRPKKGAKAASPAADLGPGPWDEG